MTGKPQTEGEALPAEREHTFWDGVSEARRFFMGEADVQQALERLRHVSLPRDLAASLDGSVRAKYEELWEAAQAQERE